MLFLGEMSFEIVVDGQQHGGRFRRYRFEISPDVTMDELMSTCHNMLRAYVVTMGWELADRDVPVQLSLVNAHLEPEVSFVRPKESDEEKKS